MQSVGAYEAKTHLPRLLSEVARGQTITITRHGVPVALLIPASRDRQQDTPAVIQALLELRSRNTLGGLKIRDLAEEGRRY